MLCYGAAQGVKLILEQLADEIESSQVPTEVILVANYWPGTGDDTPEAVLGLADGNGIVAVSAPKRGGMGWDLRSGLRRAKGDYLVFLDGDGQVPPRSAFDAYRVLAGGAAVAKGRRLTREDGPLRRVTSFAFNLLFRILFRTGPLWDVNGQPKGMTRNAYEAFNLSTDDWFTDAEIILKARALGLRVEEFPVPFMRRRAPRSFVGPATVVEFAVNMARWRLGRHAAVSTARPSRTHVARRAPPARQRRKLSAPRD